MRCHRHHTEELLSLKSPNEVLSSFNISVYIIDINSLRFPFVVILQTNPFVMFRFCFVFF